MRWSHPQSHVTHWTVVTWQIKHVISSLSLGLWTPNLAGRRFGIRGPHPQSHATHQPSGHVTNRKRYIFTFATPVDSKLIMSGSQKCHVILQICSHMTIWKRYISSTTSSMARKLSRMCTQIERSSCAKPDDTSVSWSRYKDFICTFIFTFTLPMVCGIG